MLETQPFSGQVLSRRDLPDVRIEELNYDPAQFVAPHAHSEPALVVLLSGACKVRNSQRTESECGPGTAVFHPAGETHAYRYHRAAHSRMLGLTLPRGSRCTELHQKLEDPHRLATAEVKFLSWRLMRELAQPGGGDLVLEGLAFELLGHVLDGHTPATSRVERATVLMHDRFRERIALGDIAAAVGMSPSELARAFRARYRRSVGEYLRELRLEFACRCLAGSAMPLADVALEAGFFDHSHFCRLFKSRLHLTPSEFRAAHRRK